MVVQSVCACRNYPLFTPANRLGFCPVDHCLDVSPKKKNLEVSGQMTLKTKRQVPSNLSRDLENVYQDNFLQLSKNAVMFCSGKIISVWGYARASTHRVDGLLQCFFRVMASSTIPLREVQANNLVTRNSAGSIRRPLNLVLVPSEPVQVFL